MGKAFRRSPSSAFFFFLGKASFQYGGQAVIEGVMMRGPESLAVAVRRQDGSILVERQPVPAWVRRYPCLKWPLVRGIVALLESLVVGVQVLTYSAGVAAEGEGEELSRGEIALALLLATGLAVFFFVVLPAIFGHWSAGRLGPLGQNMVEGLLRLGLFLGYLLAISRLSDIRRLFAYHGAEHKVIHAWEAGAGLQPETAGKFSRLHPRCGTSFFLLVFLLAVLLYSLVNTPGLAFRIMARLGLLPVLAGVSYELLKWSGRHAGSPPVRLLIAPGLWLQRITTREPDAGQLEVAAAALTAVLAAPVSGCSAPQVPGTLQKGLKSGCTVKRQVNGIAGET
jgi:uncharacterized protein YqhQ